MTITVKFFASLRERLGTAEREIDCAGVDTVEDAWRSITAEPPSDKVLAAVNQRYADLGDPVRDGDEVAFFPPVTGG